MVEYKKILFPITFSKNTVRITPHVQKMSEQFDTQIHLVYVSKTSEYHREDESNQEGDESKGGRLITEKVTDFVKEHLSLLKNTQVKVLNGDPTEELLKYIDDAGIDLIMMVSTGRSRMDKAVFGSVAAGVVRNAPVPVIFIQPQIDKFLN